jgi:hypothetical protein
MCHPHPDNVIWNTPRAASDTSAFMRFKLLPDISANARAQPADQAKRDQGTDAKSGGKG